jgi:hypothetical protein
MTAALLVTPASAPVRAEPAGPVALSTGHRL